MYVTSLRRLRRYLGNLSPDAESDAQVSSLLIATTQNIEQYLSRGLSLESREEYLPSEEGQRAFFPFAYPVASITSIHQSFTGEFGGEETLLVSGNDYFLGTGSRSIVLRRDTGRSHRALKIVYSGGLAEHETQSTFVVGSVTGAFTLNRFAKGSLSGAVGQVLDATAGAFIIDNSWGAFRVGDVLSEYTSEAGAATGTGATAGVAATITAISKRSLCEAHPTVVMAGEFEINFLYKNSKNGSLWTSSTSKDGTVKKTDDYLLHGNNPAVPLRPETRRLLHGYERLVL